MITTETKTSNTKITEALELLNEAAREKKDELKGAITGKYAHIRQVMEDTTERGREILDQTRHLTKDAILQTEKKVKEVASEADKRVRNDPWPYFAGVTAVSLVLGYLIGAKRK